MNHDDANDMPRCRASTWRDRLKDLLWGVVGRTIAAITAIIATTIFIGSGALDRLVQLLIGVILPLLSFAH